MKVALTTAERRVLDQVSKGKASKAIADELGISPATVHRHKASMFQKTGAWNIISLVRMFYVLRDKVTGEIYPTIEIRWNENFRTLTPNCERNQKAR